MTSTTTTTTAERSKASGPNIKFIEWLEKYLEDAERVQNKNLVFVYRKALY
jgi:hypothetical protein